MQRRQQVADTHLACTIRCIDTEIFEWLEDASGARPMPTIESKQIAIRAEILGETDNSYLLFDGKRQVWPPKDFVVGEHKRTRRGQRPVGCSVMHVDRAVSPPLQLCRFRTPIFRKEGLLLSRTPRPNRTALLRGSITSYV
jgi:hypothetical protein